MSRSAEVPVIAVVCDDPAHTEPFVVARFGKPPKPPGETPWIGFDRITTGSDWLPLPVFYDASVNPERQHLHRIEDLDYGGRYNLECLLCAPHRGRRRTVPIGQPRINRLFDGLQTAGETVVPLSTVAASMRR
jgi:hypothetical protein